MDAVTVVLNGLALLGALGWLTGCAEAAARDEEWQRFAAARRAQREEARPPTCRADAPCSSCPRRQS